MTNILTIFGTRPEAIKMAPLVKKFQQSRIFNTRVCVTAQHREMLDQVLDFFEIRPDFDLNIMSHNQTLNSITNKILNGLDEIYKIYKPDLILVHGDTTTAMVASISAFYNKIKIAHIEAGLRTNNIYSPYPEEANRQIVSILADYHFSPTNLAKQNLIKENKKENAIAVVGNTVIDALLETIDMINNNANKKNKIIQEISQDYHLGDKKFILITGHRRENFGQGFVNICEALKEIALLNPNIDIVYPVHLNPNVQEPVNKILDNLKNVFLIKPLKYENFVYLMSKCYFIITDSGGIQEEAPTFNKPVLLMRENTERPEALESGAVKLVGTNKELIIKSANELINNTNNTYKLMSNIQNPYGDGKASERIIEFLRSELI